MALITEYDDRTLVERHQGGDAEAFRTIVDRHGRSLYANALRRLGDPVQAEDAVQETLLRAFRKLDGFCGDYKLDAWLHRILTNVCHDMGRSKGRDTRLVTRVSGEVDGASPAADDALPELGHDEIVSALESLPGPYREAVVLRFIDELSYTDVADRAGISEQNARARVSRGRTMLRQMLSGVSAVFVWAVPSLRRSQPALSGAEAEAVAHAVPVAHSATALTQAAPALAQAAPAASQAAPLMAQASTLMAHAAPAVAQAAPVISNTSAAVKAVVAVGVAASVAIPAGVAVEHKINDNDAAVVQDDAAPVVLDDPVVVDADPDAEAGGQVATPVGAEDPSADDGAGEVLVLGDSVEAGSEDTADGETTGDGGAEAGDSTATDADGSTTTEEPVAEEPAPGNSDGTKNADPVTEPTPAEPTGQFQTSALTVTEAGPRLELDGAFSLVNGDVSETGQLAGKLLIGDAGEDPAAPRSIDGSLTMTFADGTTAELRVRGTVVVDAQGNTTTYSFAARFLLDGGAEHGLEESGDLTGTLSAQRNGDGSLTIDVPAAADAGTTDGGGDATAGGSSDPAPDSTTDPATTSA